MLVCGQKSPSGKFVGEMLTLFAVCCSEFCQVLEKEEAAVDAQAPGPVQYQCLDCLALFDSPDTWLEHRRTHSRSSTHSNTETMVSDQRLHDGPTPCTDADVRNGEFTPNRDAVCAGVQSVFTPAAHKIGRFLHSHG